MIRTVMVDDDIESCHIVKDILLNHNTIELVGCATNEQEFKKLVEQHNPDVVLVDIDMETPKHGLILLDWLSLHHPQINPIMLTVDEESVKDCYTLGARAYVLKSKRLSLASVIKRVFAGDIVVPNQTAHLLVSQISQASAQNQLKTELGAFTKREVEVLSHLKAERSSDQTATKMGISRFTYKRHIQNIRAKSGIFDLSELVSRFKDIL